MNSKFPDRGVYKDLGVRSGVGFKAEKNKRVSLQLRFLFIAYQD